MKKLLMIFLLTAVLMLSACTQPDADMQDTIPTLPSIQASKTPLELLTEAVDTTKNNSTYTIVYGTITTIGEDTTEDLHTQQISPTHPLDWDALYTAVPDFPTNKNLLSDFCAGPLRAIPSNTGTIRYERTDLTHAEMDLLMYDQASETEDHTIGTAAIEVDENNHFTRIEFLLEHYGANGALQRAVTIALSITFPS